MADNEMSPASPPCKLVIGELKERLLASWPADDARTSTSELRDLLLHELDRAQQDELLLRSRLAEQTSRVELLERQQDELQRHREAFDQALAGHLLTDPGGKILAANPAAAQMLRMPQGLLLGRYLFDLVLGEEDRQSLQLTISAVPPRPTPARPVRLARTRSTPLQATLTAVPIAGAPPHVRAWGWLLLDEPGDEQEHDETLLQQRVRELERFVQERTEQLEETAHAKDQFLAMLAHELRNPLGAILNAATLIQLKGPSEQQRRHALEIIERQVRHQSRMLDDLLNVSRLARGRIQLKMERVDLVQVVRNAVEDIATAFFEAKLALNTKLPPRPVWVQGDPTRLAQIVDNLLHNAGKFTPAGGRVDVLLGVDESSQPQRAVIRVRDTGVGIPRDLLPQLFDQFFQADRSLDRRHGGLGLGLTLVKGLVELHGGEVRAHSPGLGQGAEFLVQLPLEDSIQPRGVSQAQPAADRQAGHPEGAGGEVKRVLVIEDNLDAAETLCFLLESSGYEVEVAHSGLTGVAAARRFHPHVVLCDIGLPELDGYGVASELRRDPSTASARLIALSGYGQEEDRRRSREAGFEMHLVKPVSLKDLERVVEGG